MGRELEEYGEVLVAAQEAARVTELLRALGAGADELRKVSSVWGIALRTASGRTRAALHRMNCLDNMAPNLLARPAIWERARFTYTPAAEGSEPDSPVFGPAFITLLCCESLPLALCVRRVGCLQQQATTP